MLAGRKQATADRIYRPAFLIDLIFAQQRRS